MSFEKVYTEKAVGKALIIGPDWRTDHCYIVRPDHNVVWWPVLWKRGEEYRIFSVKLLDKIYQMNKKSKSVAMLWEQGISVDNKVGKILFGA